MKIIPSRSGYKSAEIKGIVLHSKYDPVKEAARFVQSVTQGEPFKCFIVLGPALGYISSELEKHYPGAVIIEVYFSEETHRNSVSRKKQAWYPGIGKNIKTFLLSSIPEQYIKAVKVISWQPSLKAFPDLAKKALEYAGQSIREVHGSVTTLKVFGRRWLKNIFANYRNSTSFLTLGITKNPVLIAASGPSLEYSLELIKKIRGKYHIWALPSSLETLLAKDIIPDLVISTDPGYWAYRHISCLKKRAIPLAAPLTGCSGIGSLGVPLVALHQKTEVEDFCISRSGIPHRSINENGTVAGSALELAQSVTGAHVVFAGLDMCYQDIKGHTKPHTFEPFFRRISNRFRPYYSTIFSQAASFKREVVEDRLIRTSPALQTYTGWFSSMKQTAVPIYRLHPSPVPLGGMTEISPHEILGSLKEFENKTPLLTGEFILRDEIKIKVLESLLKEIQKPGPLLDELNSFIDPENDSRNERFHDIVCNTHSFIKRIVEQHHK